MEWLVARDLVATRRQVLTHQIWECLGVLSLILPSSQHKYAA